MKKKKMLVAVLLALSNSAVGQPTYNHDASVYNQFLVTETGGGSLTPSLYYDALHRGYSKWAHKVNLLSVITFHVADNSERFKIMTEGVKNGESFDTIYSKWERVNRPERYTSPDVPDSER